MIIEKELVFINVDIGTKVQAIRMLGNRLYEEGYVKDSFVSSVLDREEVFPTGLPTIPYGVAIPHTDADQVIESKIAFATVKEPIEFLAMGSQNQVVDVKIIFMLALKDPDQQLGVLQKLTEFFQDEKKVAELAEVESIEAFYKLFPTL